MTAPTPVRSSGIPLVSPAFWERLRAQGRLAFVLRIGVVGVGVPFAIALNWLTISVRSDALPFLSPMNALELTLTLLLFAPPVGGLVGLALWQRAERRLGFLDASLDEPVAATAAPSAPSGTQADDEATALVRLRERLARLARDNPAALSSQSVMMALLGYAYVLGIVALVVGGIVLLLQVPNRGTVQLAIWLGVFGFVLLSALWVRVPPPDGLRVTRAGSPRLFDALAEIQRRIDAPEPDVVLVDAQLNASVIELPRYGIFGLPKRYLTLGLPLLEGMPADEVKAILAHELAHLSRRHARGSLWVGRVERTWQVLAAALESGRHWGRVVMLPFFKWYVPRLQAYANAASRTHEFEADTLAAECTDRVVTARALVRLHVLGRQLAEGVWPQIHAESASRPEPPHDALERMTRALSGPKNAADVTRWTRRVLADRTLDADTHPSLAQRVERLSDAREAAADTYVDAICAPFASGAVALIGEKRLLKVRERVGTDWQVQMVDVWRGWHALARAAKEEEGTTGEGRFAALVSRMRWAAACDTRASAIALAREAHGVNATHPETLMILGQLLVDTDDEAERAEGVRLLEEAQAHDTGIVLDACRSLEAHYARVGSIGDIERIRLRIRLLENAQLATLSERGGLSVNDPVAPHGLAPATVENIRQACRAAPQIGGAFLVRKRTAFLKEQPAIILAIELDVKWYKPAMSGAQGDAATVVLSRIQLTEPVNLTVIAISRGDGLRARLESVPGAKLSL